MGKINLSTKRLQIDKANARIVAVIAAAVFVTIFAIVGSKALLDQRAYQSRVIAEKEIAKAQLKENLEALDSLKQSYERFVTTSENVIGGNPEGEGDRDGDNAKIILDALPSKYDYPALTSSLEKILNDNNFRIDSISGTDDEIAQSEQESTPDPQPIEMPFEVTVTSEYTKLHSLMQLLEISIRPMHISSLTFSGDDEATQLVIEAHTYYQPAKSLDITTKVVQ